MSKPERTGLHAVRGLRWLLATALLIGGFYAVYRLYRWAEPSPGAFGPFPNTAGTIVTMRMENAPFEGYTQGHKSWSVWAKRLDFERLSGSSFSSIQSISITDIREGKLFKVPDTPAVSPSAPASKQDSSPVTHAASPTATFRARQGRYAINNLEPLPPDLLMSYTVQWQFKLLDDVDFRTRDGDELHADSMTILEMNNRRTGRLERRILCEKGATIRRKDTKIIANQMRYNPDERLVECLGGVRGTFKNGTVQTERAFWSLNEQVLRCPDKVSGVVDAGTFEADSLIIDQKRGLRRANGFHIRFRNREEDSLRLP